MNRLVLFFVCFLTTEGLAYTDVLDLNMVSNPHAVWIGYDRKVYYSHKDTTGWTDPVCIADDACSSSIALDKNGSPWVVWSGYDGISTAIYSKHWTGDGWSSVGQVDSIDIYYDTQPCIFIDESNKAWVVWAGGDGRDDDIYITHWNGRKWMDEVMVNVDDLSPDVSPVINIIQDKLIIVWLGYNGESYQLYQSLYDGRQWTEEEPLLVSDEGVFGELPSLILNAKGILSVYWIYKGQSYMSSYETSVWQEKVSVELLYPDQFNQIGVSSYITVGWGDEYMRNNIRFLPKKGFITGKRQMASSFYKAIIASISRFFSSSAWAGVEPNKYIAFGDSITQGYGDNGWEGEGYVPRLERKLDARITESTVINEGIGGERTFEGLGRINSVLNEHNAQYILIMEGTNDVLFGYSTESIIFNLREMLRRSKNYGTTSISGNLNPRRDSKGLNNHTKEVVNPAINALASDEDVVLADHYKELSEDVEAYINPDDCHPNGAGYELMSEVWFNAIDSMLNSPEEDDGGCGAVTLPVYKDNGRGLNLFVPALVFIVVFIYRIRLCRRY